MPAKCSRAQRRFIEPPPRIGKAAAVAPQHFDIGEAVMPEGDGLRRLKMRETRHDGRRMLERLLRQCLLQAGKLRIEMIDGLAQMQAHVGGDLVIARTCRMQPPGGLADQLLQPRFDIHVDVFERARKGETACRNFLQYEIEAPPHFRRIGF